MHAKVMTASSATYIGATAKRCLRYNHKHTPQSPPLPPCRLLQADSNAPAGRQAGQLQPCIPPHHTCSIRSRPARGMHVRDWQHLLQCRGSKRWGMPAALLAHAAVTCHACCGRRTWGGAGRQPPLLDGETLHADAPRRLPVRQRCRLSVFCSVRRPSRRRQRPCGRRAAPCCHADARRSNVCRAGHCGEVEALPAP